MDALTALVAGLVGSLRSALAIDVCPGGWPWAVSAFGVGVGMFPTAGAVTVAVLRKRIGSRYGAAESVLLAGLGLVAAGLLPLVAFTATGRVFDAVARGRDVEGLSASQLADLGTTECVLAQSDYLGGFTVADAFDPAEPGRFGLAVVLLVGFPLAAAMFVAAQARLALRRGPRWPAKFFWVPLLALTVLTAQTPAGASGQLWIGITAGAFLGIVVVLLVGAPSREVVRQSMVAPRPRSAGRRGRSPAEPVHRQVPAPRREPPAAAPSAPRSSAPRSSLAERMAARFAARQPEPPVLPPPRSGPRVSRPAGPPRPTLVAPAPPFAPAGTPRFRLVRKLGSGGFGRVWLAHDMQLGHPVALKAAHTPDAETEERLRREARALAAVRHPHCVQIHDLLPASSDPGLSELEGMVIVMEFVEGQSLGDLVGSRGLLDDVAAAHVWAGVAGALEAAHAHGVMHRDVKPANIVLDRAGLAHLIDFGIARRSGDSTLTMAGFVLGTPDFLPPEVARGERATPASDAWQLAATISYALTGYPPRGGHPDAISGLRAAASGAPLTHLPHHSAHLPLLRASMDADPRRRPPLRAVQAALGGWLRPPGRPAGPVSAGAPPR